jgi:DNA-binding NarL/FixJ family response regulator
MKTDKLKILVADDHPLFRMGVVQTLSNFSENEIFEAEEGNEAIQKIIEIRPEIAVIDLRMPGKTGLEILKELRKVDFSVKVILLTMYKNVTYFYQAATLGAKGYLLKETAVDELVIAVKSVLAGNVFISSRLHELITSEKKDAFQNKTLIEAINSLTKSEREVIKLLSEWKTNCEIAEILSNSPRTIENHRAKISEKLNLQGIHSLIKFAIENKELF